MARLSACVTALISLGCASAGAGTAAQHSISGTASPNVRREIARLNLPKLPDSANTASVSYTAGYERRARRVRQLVAGMTAYYARELGTTVDVQVAVLDTAAWSRVSAPAPYPIPFVSDSPSVAVVPASLAGTLADTRGAPVIPASMIPPAAAGEMIALGVTPADLPDLARDAIILHELGHVYSIRYGIAPPRRWASELLATYWQQIALAATLPALSDFGDRMNQAAASAPPAADAYAPKFTSLADLDRLNGTAGMGPRNYEWYEGALGRRATAVRQRYGIAFLSAARTAFPAGVPTPVTDAAVYVRLQEVAPMQPSWSDWAMSLERQASRPH